MVGFLGGCLTFSRGANSACPLPTPLAGYGIWEQPLSWARASWRVPITPALSVPVVELRRLARPLRFAPWHAPGAPPAQTGRARMAAPRGLRPSLLPRFPPRYCPHSPPHENLSRRKPAVQVKRMCVRSNVRTCSVAGVPEREGQAQRVCTRRTILPQHPLPHPHQHTHTHTHARTHNGGTHARVTNSLPSADLPLAACQLLLPTALTGRHAMRCGDLEFELRRLAGVRTLRREVRGFDDQAATAAPTEAPVQANDDRGGLAEQLAAAGLRAVLASLDVRGYLVRLRRQCESGHQTTRMRSLCGATVRARNRAQTRETRSAMERRVRSRRGAGGVPRAWHGTHKEHRRLLLAQRHLRRAVRQRMGENGAATSSRRTDCCLLSQMWKHASGGRVYAPGTTARGNRTRRPRATRPRATGNGPASAQPQPAPLPQNAACAQP